MRKKHTEAKIESDCPKGETQAKILARWQATLKIQIKEENYKINNCQISFLYDLKLAARLSSLNMCELTDVRGLFCFVLFLANKVNDSYTDRNWGIDSSIILKLQKQ